MRRWIAILMGAMFLAGTAFAAGDLQKSAKEIFQPIPATPPQLQNNPITRDKVELGKMLYFDPRLSASHLISCNTCHSIGLGGADLQTTSVGHGWQKGPRNAPTVLNAVFNVAQFWDGRAKDLAEQAKGPVQASVEMNSAPALAVSTLKSMPAYVALFEKAFPNAEGPVTFDNMANAIEAFEATLLTPNSRFDLFLKGDESALDAAEKEGLGLFMGKGCSGCHGGINVGGQDYFPFGVVEKPGADILPPDDKGRFAVTKTASDEYVFKAPSLRNVALTAPYFHSGEAWSLPQAVAVMGATQLGIQLDEGQTQKIVAFLDTLTGKQPEVVYPILPPSSPTTPHPMLAVKPAAR
jgi:cytochrome c peroxidase